MMRLLITLEQSEAGSGFRFRIWRSSPGERIFEAAKRADREAIRADLEAYEEAG